MRNSFQHKNQVDPRNDQGQAHPAQFFRRSCSSNRKTDRKVTMQEAGEAFLEDEHFHTLAFTIDLD
jgi:hypothetical protein